ncbi:ANTAR domain-containing protein [Pseudonocardia sp.]|jgi:anti-anti-sigma factor|uniref:ANTAR domain-containing protein n=1 Tax=Pseudonocardia sp. TaxID=60912 RepID=UPI0031FCB772
MATSRRPVAPCRSGVGLRRPCPGVAVVMPCGEIDLATAPRFLKTLVDAVDSAERVVVDLGGLTFFSSAGVWALMRLRDRARAGACDVRLAGLGDGVVGRVLAIARVQALFTVHETVEDALAAGEPPGTAADVPDEPLTGLVGLARDLLDASTVDDVLARIVTAAPGVVPGADHVSMSVHADGESWRTPAPADPRARSVLSLELLRRSRIGAFGTLDVHRIRPGDLEPVDLDRAVVLAAHTSIALAAVLARTAGEREKAQLRRAIRSRDVIGQAKGLLMERRGIGEDEAFAILRGASQSLNVKLAVIAESLANGETDI